ncbi:MAG TPA: response regulator [Candidatus Omnitrophota bacterium]|nr:response regulator [Candidatus Omnitrophota bacterium]
MGKVLIVDDNRDMRKRYRKVLTEEKIGCFEAPEALKVSELLMREKSNIDLILLDIQIPEIDGRGIYDIIFEYAPQIPIIVSSVLPVNEQKLRIPRARGYFNKADGDQKLLKQVKTVLGLS